MECKDKPCPERSWWGIFICGLSTASQTLATTLATTRNPLKNRVHGITPGSRQNRPKPDKRITKTVDFDRKIG